MHRVVRRAGLALAAVAGLLSLYGCGGTDHSPAAVPPKPPTVLQTDPEILKPFLWFQFSAQDFTDSAFAAELDYGDPLHVTTLLMQDWLAKHDAAVTTARIDQMIAKWKLEEPDAHTTYLFAYGRLPTNWWSGMDMYALPMLLLDVGKTTDNARYVSLSQRLLATAKKPVADGGAVWPDSGACWLSEYNWTGMLDSDEFYVLNGHLYALLALRLVAENTGDEKLQSLYRCGLAATKARADQYLIADGWPRYMLQPPVINEVHYVIFEAMLFEALAKTDNDYFYTSQANIRHDILARYFPLHFYSDQGTNRLALSIIGPPHPYLLDTYPLDIKCDDGVRREAYSLSSPGNSKQPLADTVFLDVVTQLNPNSARCKVSSVYGPQSYEIYDKPVTPLSGPVGEGTVVGYTLEASLDATLVNDTTVLIDPTRTSTPPGQPPTYLDTQGRIQFTPVQALNWGPDSLLGLEFNADGGLSIGVTVVSNGVEYFRYYPATTPGNRNLVLLSPLGFDGGASISNVEKLTVFVYTDKQTASVTVTAPRLIMFKNQVELYHYFRHYSPNFVTQ